jgi:hydrogenase expression/formation protein HypC
MRCAWEFRLVVEADELTALVDFWGVRRRVRLALVDEPVAAGDYVLNHVGFAIRRIPPEDVRTTLDMYEQLLKDANRDDLMTADVRSEIEAGSADARLKRRAPADTAENGGARGFSRAAGADD